MPQFLCRIILARHGGGVAAGRLFLLMPATLASPQPLLSSHKCDEYHRTFNVSGVTSNFAGPLGTLPASSSSLAALYLDCAQLKVPGCPYCRHNMSRNVAAPASLLGLPPLLEGQDAR